MEKTWKNSTTRLWIDCLIKPTLLALMLLRAEKDGDFLLQQQCLEMMLPYVFAACHYNYARYISWYLRQMQHILQDVKKICLLGPWYVVTQTEERLFSLINLLSRHTSNVRKEVAESKAFQPMMIDAAFDVMDGESNKNCHEDLGVQKKMKEGKQGRKVDEDDRRKVSEALANNSHPLK